MLKGAQTPGDKNGSAPGLPQICYLSNHTYLTFLKIWRLNWRKLNLNMHDEYTRNRILALSNANKTPTEIVSILHEENIVIARTTVARIIWRTREKKQGEQHQDRRGRPLKASSPVKRKINAVYRQNPEVTASELKNILENELTGIRIGVSTIKRARKAAGWICTQTRYCQMVRDANKIKHLEFCRKIIETNDDFGNVIFTDESSVEIE